MKVVTTCVLVAFALVSCAAPVSRPSASPAPSPTPPTSVPAPSAAASWVVYQTAPSFHSDAASLYQVAVAADPRSERWLMWSEAGSWSLPGSKGVPYVLSATGLTDMEFWRFADSLHPNQI